jgi:hypothetical protein
MTPGPHAGCRLQGRPYRCPTTVLFKRLPPSASSSSSLSSSSPVLLLLTPPLAVVVIIVIVKPHRGIPCERVTLPRQSAVSAHLIDGGGTTEVPEVAEQDCRVLLWSLPLPIVFFTITVVVIVTVSKGGHSLGAMECAPSFWLPWMAWQKRGECAIMVVGCGV